MDSAPVVSTLEHDPQNAIGDHSRAHLASTQRATLLATARIIVGDSGNSRITARALVDPGAERSFITTRLSALLNPSRRKASVMISGVGAKAVATAFHEVTISLCSPLDDSFNLPCTALVLNKLTVCCSLKPSLPSNGPI